jgi:phosphopantothenoylcysteine decarboxylase/phosphopantothenate--cysteine ligase
MAKILLGVTGSIAAYKACDLTSKLIQKGHEVRVILSDSAKNFVGSVTFEGLTSQPVLTTGFEEGNRMAHIHWARWADLILVYPATANTINQMAQGLGADLLGMIFLAHEFKKDGTQPFWIAPAMNPSMLAHPATQTSLEKLASWGVKILESGTGRTACGEEGSGRLIEPLAALAAIEEFFGAKNVQFKGKILITAGGTSEPIDPVRVLTNTSTGETGVQIAQSLKKAGFDVSLLLAQSSTALSSFDSDMKVSRFSDFNSLHELIKKELSSHDYQTVIHAAAVSDYSIAQVESLKGEKISNHQKIHSGEGIKIALKPNPKIVNSLREFSRNKDICVISFKLTTTGEAPHLKAYDSDFIVHNDLAGISRGTDRHEGSIYSKSGQVISRFDSKSDLNLAIQKITEGNLGAEL